MIGLIWHQSFLTFTRFRLVFFVMFQLRVFKMNIFLIYLYQRHSPQVTGWTRLSAFVSKVVE